MLSDNNRPDATKPSIAPPRNETTMKLRNPSRTVRRSLALACLLICSGLSAEVAAAEIAADFPIWVELDKPQLVTVVIEDAAGQRVRNLVAEMQLPAGWQYDELNAPAIPGSVETRDGTFTLTGCGHAMTSFWERVRDQGAFVSKPTPGDFEMSARLMSLSRNAGGPNAYSNDSRTSGAGLGLWNVEQVGMGWGGFS